MNNNILSFVRRYWRNLLLFVFTIGLAMTDVMYRQFGTFVYLPALFSAAVNTALLVRHFFFRSTLDEDAHSGYFTAAWVNLDPPERVKYNLIVTCVLILSASLIAASLAK